MLRHRFTLFASLFLMALGTALWLGCTSSGSGDGATDGGGEEHGHEHTDGEEDGHEHEAHLQNVGGPKVANFDASSPDATMTTFLDAVKIGDAESAASLLTTKARTEMQNAEMHVLPPGSPRADYSVNNVSYEPEHGGAFVDTTWIDDDETGQRQSYDITWILRQENNSWRVAGMSTKLVPDHPPLVLNFEDPVDMKAQVQQANAEMMRRAEGEIRQATLPPDANTLPQQ